MKSSLLQNTPDFVRWTWADIEPQYAGLEARELTPASVDLFLRDWSALAERIDETGAHLYIATTQDTADDEAKKRYHAFLDEIVPKAQAAEQRLREKLIASGLEPHGFEIQLRRMRTDAALFREENIPLQTEQAKLGERYLSIVGGQTVEWEGKTVSLTQLSPVLAEPDRERRERAWRLMSGRRLQDRAAIDDVWQKLLALRQQEATNAGFPDYRSYRWSQLKRFDYSPDDAKALNGAVEEVVVPVVARLYERRKERMGVETLRPWDLLVDPLGRPPLHPFERVDELTTGISSIFHRLDPELGNHFDTMQQAGLLDLESRLDKAPIGYMYPLAASRRPFIFFEATGQRFDVEALLHEGGHAMHVFESSHLPYYAQRNPMDIPMEFVEVGSMAMEFLGEPYLTRDKGGFYSAADAARARLDHIEQRVLALWCRTAQGDAFQHWVYEHPEVAMNPDRVDAAWLEVSRRFSPVVDWSGLEEERETGWQAVSHFFEAPFYMIEYALAQLASVQIAANARRDQRDAVRRYRHALALGGTATLPELYAASGARFAFDADTFREAVRYLEEVIEELDSPPPSAPRTPLEA